MLSEKDLIGVWRLTAHYYLHEDGSISEGPLGKGADGVLIYDATGWMGVGMMRTESVTATADAGTGPPLSFYLGYTGRWRVSGDEVVHEVTVGSHPRVADTDQVREARLHDGGLSLRRPVLPGSTRYIVMDWCRAGE